MNQAITGKFEVVSLPVINERKTARINMTVEPTLKDLAKRKAKAENRDLSQILSRALLAYLVS